MAQIETKVESQIELPLIRQEGNIFWAGATGFAARGERIIIREDSHKSGYECLRCMDREHHTLDGKQVSTLTCEACAGEGKRPKAGNAELTVKCSDCEGRGFVPCPDCGGKGTSTGIVLPDSSKSEPMTGTVVSKGPQAKVFEIGDRVLFPSYSGNRSTITVKEKKTGREEKVRLRFIEEGDIKAQLYGELELRSFDGSQALYTNE